LQYLYVQSGEVAVKVLRVIDVRLCADRTHHISDVLVPHRYGEMLLETSTAHRALAGCQRLHLSSTPKDRLLTPKHVKVLSYIHLPKI